jgi:hypothetical protein
MLRASRSASLLSGLNKSAGSPGGLLLRATEGVGRATVKGIDKTLQAVGGTIRKHPVGSLATVGGVGAGGMEMAQGFRKGVEGVSPEYAQAQRLGYAPPLSPGYPFSYDSLR